MGYQFKISNVDDNGNNSIDFPEFLRFIRNVYSYELVESDEDIKETEEQFEERAKASFQLFDKDGSGTISTNELKQVILNCEEKLTEKEIKEIFKDADIDGNGTVTYDGNLIIQTFICFIIILI
jgi:Ca2+-binding EF-hand superfamily protein